MTDESTIVCIASGPSLTQEDVDFVRGKAKVFVCNDGYKVAPWADLLYAADSNWWEYHLPYLKEFRGERWTCDAGIAEKYKIQKVLIRNCLHFTNGCAIAGGANSGFQLLNIAAMRQPKQILLLGYDMKETTEKSHWFGDHPLKIRRPKPSPYPRFIRAFEQAAPLIKPRVINATRDTALTCFDRKSLQEVFP